MIHSPTLTALAPALTAAQAEFESVSKNADNPFFKSKYADLAAIVKAASPVLAKHKLAVVQFPGWDGVEDTLTTLVVHESGEFWGDTMRLHMVKDDPQAQGSAISYARRYSYQAALGIVTEKDDDGNAATKAWQDRPRDKQWGRPTSNSERAGAATYVQSRTAKVNLMDRANQLVGDPVVAKQIAEKVWGDRGTQGVPESVMEKLMLDVVDTVAERTVG